MSLNDEQREIEEFEHEMERRRPRLTAAEVTIYAVAWAVYLAFIIYAPLSIFMGWWPW